MFKIFKKKEREENFAETIKELQTITSSIDERLKNVERMVSELYRMAKEA